MRKRPPELVQERKAGSKPHYMWERETHFWTWKIQQMSLHGKANMYPGVESIHKKILSQSLEWNENVNYDRDFIQCFRNLRPQGLWHAISSRSGDAGFLLAFRYFLSTHSTPLKIYETLKAAGLCWIGTFKVIFQHDSSSLSFFVLWLSIFFLIYCLTLSSLVLVPILSATID